MKRRGQQLLFLIALALSGVLVGRETSAELEYLPSATVRSDIEKTRGVVLLDVYAEF